MKLMTLCHPSMTNSQTTTGLSCRHLKSDVNAFFSSYNSSINFYNGFYAMVVAEKKIVEGTM